MGLNVKTGAYSVQEKTQKEVFAHVDEAEISQDTKGTTVREEIDKADFIEIKNMCSAKGTVNMRS